jgi:VanZ family protein
LHRVPFPLAGIGAEPIMGRRVSWERFLKVWGPVIVWAAVIFALSSVPSLNSGLGTWDTVLRKCAHVTEYAILGFLLLRALGRELPALLLGVVYAATDELHQHFVAGRHASPVDLAIDTLGVLIGVLVVRGFLQSRRA